jgi:ABC-type Fe3+-hydroxamate transport system substrate-binding protein
VSRDDLGTTVDLPQRVSRVVSLVPSLTEAIATTVPEVLVGATTWCTHPANLDVVRVRGTKNPDLRAIAALRPDLVIANQEENRRLDVERLRKEGIAVWVSDIRSVRQALGSLTRLFAEALQVGLPPWLGAAEAAWPDEPVRTRSRVAVPIWRDPWMVVGPDTFAGDLLRLLGCSNVFADADSRYPRTSVADIGARRPEMVVLPDEPYAFSAVDGPDCFPPGSTRLVSGRMLTWYGPSMCDARTELSRQLGFG